MSFLWSTSCIFLDKRCNIILNLLSKVWMYFTCKMWAARRLVWTHLDSSSVSWWIPSRSLWTWKHPCRDYSPACRRKALEKAYLNIRLSFNLIVLPLQSVSRRCYESLDVRVAFPEQPSRRGKLSYAGSCHLGWTSRPVSGQHENSLHSLPHQDTSNKNIQRLSYMYFITYSEHCTRTIPSKAECSHTTPHTPSIPTTNWEKRD